MKQLKTNERTNKFGKYPSENELKQEFVKLKSEFELLQLCQRNNNTRLISYNIPVISSKCINCNDLVFKTETGLKVHNDLVHQTENESKEDLKCKHCKITYSDLEVMKKHNEREHIFKCKICDETCKVEVLLNTHSSAAHAQIIKSKQYSDTLSGESISLLFGSLGRRTWTCQLLNFFAI